MSFTLFGIRFSVTSDCVPLELNIKFKSMETYIVFRKNYSLGWNSEHIAKWFGKYHEGNCDYGFSPDYYEYNGVLGRHHLI